MDDLKAKTMEIYDRLLETYGEPTWRNPLPPLDELISTILSQNTNDDNRDLAFNRLRDRFSTWEAVREADTEQVAEAIRPAGLANQKAPRIQAALDRIVEERGELDLNFLKDWDPEEARRWLTDLKGVGPKTASIVQLFSLGMQSFPVDTHVHRVTGRLGLIPQGMSAAKAHETLADLFPPETYESAHLNLIRHGRQVCKARKPLCSRCVLTDLCRYYQEIRQGTDPGETP